MKIAPVAVRAVAVSLVLAATQGACGGGSPTTPPTTTTSTTSTTTSTTSTTTSTTSTTTTSTTSTTSTTTTTTTTSTLPRVSYAVVHQIWSSRNCNGCHTSANRLNLSGGPTATCAIVSSGSDAAGGQYLDEPACTANASSIVRVPSTGMRPDGQPHPGGADACFAGGTCRTEILAWCSQGANCTN